MPKRILIEDKGMVVQFPDHLSDDEIGNIIRQDVYGEDLEATPEPLEKVEKGAKSLWRGIQQPILSSPQAAGSLLLEFGERMEKEPTFLERAFSDAYKSVVGIPAPMIYKRLKQFVGKKTNLDENIAKAGQEMIDQNKAFMERKKLIPEEGRLNRFLFNLGSGVTTLGGAIGVSVLTRSPHTAAVMFGAYQKANLYQEAREAGLKPEYAGDISTVGGIVEGSLEYIGLDFMFKRYGSRLFGLAIRSGTEALQEFSQTTGENIIVGLGGIDPLRPVFEGAGESALIGFILGGTASIGLDLMRKNNVKKALIDKGLTKDQAEKVISKINDSVRKEAGDITAEEISEIVQTEPVKEEKPPIEEPTKAPIVSKADALREEAAEIEELEYRKIFGEVPKIMKKETTFIRQRIKDIETGIRQGKIINRKDIKNVQNEVIDLINRSGLEAKDKAKFISTVKNIQTQEQLKKSLRDIQDRIETYRQAATKTKLDTQIRKQLKTTKPVKKGQRRVGRYDYESNKLFEDLRNYNKMNKKQAQDLLDAFPEEVTSGIDLIKKRLLSLRSMGKEASAEIYQQVAKDIAELKRMGEQAKDEADFEKLVNRQEIVEDALNRIDKIEADKKNIKTKIINIYRRGFSNLYSMFNSMLGKDFAEENNPELSESRRGTATYKKTADITDIIAEIYGEKNVLRVFDILSRKDYKITDFEGLTTEISKMELIDIYNSIKNDKRRKQYYDAFGEAQVQSLLGNLTETDTDLGDYLQDEVQEYRNILNQRNIELFGRDLRFVENYWMSTSEHQVNVLDDIRIQGEIPSPLKERIKGKVIPIPQNAWLKTQRHIAQAEHVAHLSREHERLKRLFSDRKVKHAIKEKFGDGVYSTLMNQIDGISLNAQVAKIDAVSQAFKIAIDNWVTAKIALNPNSFVRQLMSVGNYIEYMNPAEWTTGFFKGILTPKKTFDFMWKNAPFLEARFNKGYSEALADALDSAKKMGATSGSYTKFLSSLVRGGDVAAIIYGGYPLVRSELAKHGNMKRAIDVFEKATLKSQQSGLASSLSQFQSSKNPFARLFLAFKNTSNQYFRKMADAIISYQNNDISLAQFSKIMTIYAVIQPILYASSGVLVKYGLEKLGGLIFEKDDEDIELQEKLMNAIMTQIVVSPVNAIPLIDDITTFAIRKLTGQKIWKVFSTPLLDELETGARKLTKEEPSAGDYLTAMASVLEPITRLPINTYRRIFKNIVGDYYE